MNDRWKTSCHEAGHALAAVALGGKCGGLVVFPDGGGLAAHSQLSRDAVAFVAAAGPAAESLVERFNPPVLVDALPTCPLTPDEIEQLSVYATSPHIACDMGRAVDDRKAGIDDDVSMAHWAISGHESDPESWSRRVDFAKRVAAEIVQDNTSAIVRVAESLFRAGSLGETEILQLIEGN